MVFKRRNPRSWLQFLADGFYPKGGWSRAVSYVVHRLRRLPDAPHKIARGIAVGVFVSFTPFFGFHFVFAAVFAFLLQGNILASLLATFVGNPLTFPIIATVSLELGNWMLGTPGGIPLPQVFDEDLSAQRYAWVFEERGVTFEDNTDAEIRALLREMLDRHEGRFEVTADDEDLQRRYRALLKPNDYCYGAVARVGRDWLRENRHLLED